MEAPPSGSKRISVMALLLPFVLPLLLMAGLTAWQMRANQQPAKTPELMAAGNALSANNVEQARRQFEKALGKAEDPATMYRNIMEECGQWGRWDMAVQYGERAIQVCRYVPDSVRAELYEVLAGCYAEGHEPPPQPRAIEYARRALELAPEDAKALNTLGYFLAENVRTEPEANIALGYVNYALNLLRNQFGASAELLAQVEDSYGWALYKRGKFHSEDYAHAADALRQAVSNIPSGFAGSAQKVLYYHLGVACHAAGQIEDARHALQIALVYDPQYADAQRELNSLPSAPPAAPSNTLALPAAPTPTVLLPHAPAAPTQTSDGKPIFKPLSDNKLVK